MQPDGGPGIGGPGTPRRTGPRRLAGTMAPESARILPVFTRAFTYAARGMAMNGVENTLQMPLRGPHEQRREPERPAAVGILGDSRRGARARLHDRVQQASAPRLRARRFVRAAMRDARLGRTIDVPGACGLVEGLLAGISDDAGTTLWRTNLPDRDEYTSIHCVNVCVLTLAFGVHLGLERHELLRLGVGALLHDIGKTRTPGEILHKAGDLTPGELAIIQRHPEDGYALMAADQRMPREALDVIRLHHERIDGRGYPFGLSGDQIPLHVRIAAVVDAYDTMTSDRPYSRARPAAEAIKALQEQADAHFGDGIVQAFTRYIDVIPVASVVESDSHAPEEMATVRDRGDTLVARRIYRAIAPAPAEHELLQCAG